MKPEWLDRVKRFVAEVPIVVLRMQRADWTALAASRRGTSEFSTTFHHDYVRPVRSPCLCLIEAQGESALSIGWLRSKAAVTTLQSRVKVVRCAPLEESSLAGLADSMENNRSSGILRKRAQTETPVVALSSAVSVQVVETLAKSDSNLFALNEVHAELSRPKSYSSIGALQEDALRSALKAFGVETDDALTRDVDPERESAVSRLWVTEDSVIEHDARTLPGFSLVTSDITGHATFVRDDQYIEVITANKRPLEELFGVDLILFNMTHENVVMLQYKMLEPENEADVTTDWVYRPDGQMEKEIERMKMFDADLAPGSEDYRLNPGMFYFKWVKRDASLRKSGILTPLAHFQLLRTDPACRGPRGGFRISFDSLRGRYLRERPFLDLVSAGYIGTRAATTDRVEPLVRSALQGNRAVVAAVKSRRKTPIEASGA